MVRRVGKLAIVLVLLWLATWGVATMVAPRLLDTGISYALAGLEGTGIKIDSIRLSTVTVSPTLTSITAREVRAAFDLAPTDSPRLRSVFESRRIEVGLDRIVELTGRLEIDEFEIVFHETDRPRRFPFDRLTAAEMTIGDLPILAPRRALRQVRDGLESMLVDNEPVEEFQLEGTVMVAVRDQLLPARLYTEPLDGRFRLRFDRDDVQTLVEEARIDLSAEQIEIISLYPVRVPFLIDITRRARRIAWNTYPERRYHRDALRHVVWSYLLTIEFGPEFAKEVTDAQETRPGNTPAERAMDYHNNAVGRRLAAVGAPLDSLPKLVASHPDVIRHPREVDSRQELLR